MSKTIPNPEVEKLVSEIDAYRDKNGMSETGFGAWAVNDPNFVRNLREGREPRWSTIRKLRDKMGATQ